MTEHNPALRNEARLDGGMAVLREFLRLHPEAQREFATLTLLMHRHRADDHGLLRAVNDGPTRIRDLYTLAAGLGMAQIAISMQRDLHERESGR